MRRPFGVAVLLERDRALETGHTRHVTQTLLADLVLTLDAVDTVYAPGAVVMDGPTIVSVGPLTERVDREVVDLSGHLLMPGLVNTHTHSDMWLYRGMTEDVPRGEWLSGRMMPIAERVGPEQARAGALASCLEMVLNGTTTVADRGGHMDSVASAVEASGLRAIVAQSTYDKTVDGDFAAAKRLIARFGTDPSRSRVTAGLGPHATDTCGPDTLRRVRRLADQSGARVFIHLAQSLEEVAAVRERGYAGCAAYLDELGLLAPDVVVAHATYLSDEEAELVGRRGTAVAHCPSSNAKLEGRVAPVGRLRSSGAVVALGTDAAACNNGMDLLQEMKVAGLLNKVMADDPSTWPVVDVVRMATTEAARALGIDQLVGSLEPGKRADLVAIRMNAPHLAPWHDHFANLVYAARGSDVAQVWVDGEQVVKDGAPVRLDVERVLADAYGPAAVGEGLTAFLARIVAWDSCVRTPERMGRVVRELREDLAEDGVVYAELRRPGGRMDLAIGSDLLLP